MSLNTIPEALKELEEGRIIIVMDDEDRENEGDLICSSELCTPEMVNFMSTHGKGLICVSITDNRAKELDLEMMVTKSSALHDTKFTVSVDYVHGTTTGISSSDRAATIRALADSDTKPEDLARPGHIFPLVSVPGGVLRRSGHTEATVDLMKLAGLKPCGVLCEIINEDGSMARLDDIKVFAEKHDLKIITVKDLIAYRLESESLIEKKAVSNLRFSNGLEKDWRVHTFESTSDGREHLILTLGKWEQDEEVMVRAHSENFLENILGSMAGKQESKLQIAINKIEEHGKGAILVISSDSRIGRITDFLESNPEIDVEKARSQTGLGMARDSKDFGVGAQILSSVGIKKMKLLTNSPKKRVGLSSYGIEITGTVPFE
ncbi:MAG: 3,4-dihydroxy-2-butanone-4-phosphate synthase [Candidatus Kapaibacteriales bacterium]